MLTHGLESVGVAHGAFDPELPDVWGVLLKALGSDWIRPEVPCRCSGSAPLAQKASEITMAEVKSIVEPDGVGNDIRGIDGAYKYSWTDFSNFS